jgi:F0F1-type ATP synthase membrane subunit b/b'
LTIALGVSGFFWLSFVALAVMLWVVYKTAVPGLTASLSEVAPEIKAQLSAIAPQQRGLRRVALVALLAGLILLGLALVALTGHSK